MKTKQIILILSVSLITGLYSCELLNDTPGLTVAEQLEGTWLCEENNPYKSAEDFFNVYIDINPIDSNTISISNFFQLGSNVYATAEISGMTLTLPNQTIGDGFKINGSGTISNNYKTITWHYYVDDGSGDWKEVNSVYTKGNY